jgi:hypothetical protein
MSDALPSPITAPPIRSSPSIAVSQEALPRVIGTRLTTTAATTLFTASSGKNVTEAVTQLRVTNLSGSSQTVTIHWLDSSASSNIAVYYQYPLAPGGTLIDADLKFRFDASDAIKATASASNIMDVILLISERGRSF